MHERDKERDEERMGGRKRYGSINIDEIERA